MCSVYAVRCKCTKFFIAHCSFQASHSLRSPSPVRPPRKKACKGKEQSGGGTGKGKGKGKGKGREKASEVWTTDDPGTTYPDFSSPFGPTLELPYDAPPVDYLNQVYPPHLVTLLVEQTNLYAHQRGVSGWVDTTATEMMAFLCFVMATAIHRVPRLNNIWCADWVLAVPPLAAIFTRSRFWQLWSNLHLADNMQAPDRSDPSFDRLYKLHPMLNILADAFQAAHQPSQQISVDEAMVRYKGRSSLKQYLPNKPIKRGFKIWCLCDANGGYLQAFQIYTGMM